MATTKGNAGSTRISIEQRQLGNHITIVKNVKWVRIPSPLDKKIKWWPGILYQNFDEFARDISDQALKATLMLKIILCKYPPQIALIFHGQAFELRIIPPAESDEHVKDFYDYFSENRYPQHDDDELFIQAIHRFADCLSADIKRPDSPVRNLTPQREKKQHVSPDKQVFQGAGSRVIANDLERVQDETAEEDHSMDNESMTQDYEEKKPSAKMITKIQDQEDSTSIDIDPRAPWREVFNALLRARWKWYSHELHSKILVRPDGKGKIKGKLNIDFFPTDACGHGNEIKEYAKANFGWIGNEVQSESSYTSGESSPSTLASSKKEDKIRDGDMSTGMDSEFGKVSDEDNDDMVNDDADCIMEENVEQVHSSSSTPTSNDARESSTRKQTNVPDVIETKDIFEFNSSDAESDLSETEGRSWDSVWDELQKKGWSVKPGTNKYEPYYLRPGLTEVRGQFQKDLFYLQHLKDYARGCGYKWKEENETAKRKLKVDAQSSRKKQKKTSSKGVASKEIKSSKRMKKNVAKSSNSHKRSDASSKIVTSRKSKSTRKEKKKVIGRKSESMRKEKKNVTANLKSGKTKSKQFQKDEKQNSGDKDKYSSNKATKSKPRRVQVQSPITFRYLKAVEGWTTISASRFNKLHDWYYLAPSVSAQDIINKTAKLGKDYFLDEPEAVQFATENQHLLKNPIGSGSPNSSSQASPEQVASVFSAGTSEVKSPQSSRQATPEQGASEARFKSPAGTIEVKSSCSTGTSNMSQLSVYEDFKVEDCNDCWWLNEAVPRFKQVWSILHKKFKVKARVPEYVLPDGKVCNCEKEVQIYLCKNGLPSVSESLTSEELKLVTRFASLAHLPRKIRSYPLDHKMHGPALFKDLPGGSSFNNSSAKKFLFDWLGCEIRNDKFYCPIISSNEELYDSIDEIRMAIRENGLNISWGENETIDEVCAALILWSSVLPLPQNYAKKQEECSISATEDKICNGSDSQSEDNQSCPRVPDESSTPKLPIQTHDDSDSTNNNSRTIQEAGESETKSNENMQELTPRNACGKAIQEAGESETKSNDNIQEGTPCNSGGEAMQGAGDSEAKINDNMQEVTPCISGDVNGESEMPKDTIISQTELDNGIPVGERGHVAEITPTIQPLERNGEESGPTVEIKSTFVASENTDQNEPLHAEVEDHVGEYLTQDHDYNDWANLSDHGGGHYGDQSPLPRQHDDSACPDIDDSSPAAEKYTTTMSTKDFTDIMHPEVGEPDDLQGKNLFQGRRDY